MIVAVLLRHENSGDRLQRGARMWGHPRWTGYLMALTPRMRYLTGFAPLAEAFDGFILDLWGVIHDGVTPYPGAIDCLARLRATGKPTVMLSNVPRRAASVQ